jgi:phage baseplate assembly protein W
MANSIISETTINLPFSIDSYGNVASTTNQPTIWQNRVKSAVGTLQTERIMRPKFGTKIPLELFDASDLTLKAIQNEIQSVFTNLLPLLTLDTVNVYFDEYTNVITADIVYDLPDQKKKNLVIGLVVVSGTKTPYEEKV